MKRKLLAIASGIVIVGSGIGLGLSPDSNTTAVDSPIGEQLQDHENRLNNHEARIKNTENDVKVLQDNTGTKPSPDRVEVPAVPTKSSTTTPSTNAPSSPAPSTTGSTPVTVVSYEKVPNGENTDCKFTYSDGTTYQWPWQRVEYNQGTKITYTDNVCDDSVIGKAKT